MNLNILLIEGDFTNASAIRKALLEADGTAFHVEWFKTCAAGLERLTRPGKHSSESVLAVLLDLFLPDSQGLETFERLSRAAPQIPILVLSTAGHEDIARMAVQRGAQDYLVKGCDYSGLLPKALDNMLIRSSRTEALADEGERAQVMLHAIRDAVLSTDVWGTVSYLNPTAEALTGWSRAEATGRSVEEVLRLVDVVSHEALPNPIHLAMQENTTKALVVDCGLIRPDGSEIPIEDSIAPIVNRHGQVTGAIMVFRDASAERALSVKTAYLAQHDALTGLPNRTLFKDRLSQSMALSDRHQTKLAVLYLDLDRFKPINDSLGHPVGDRVLQSVSQRLLSCVRASDTVCRQGGDEFVILLPELEEAQDASITADKMLQLISATHRLDQHDLHLSASIGIAVYPDDAADAETLMKNADIAMYYAKDSGRNDYKFFKQSMNRRAAERQAIADELYLAVERQEFVLHYQPIVDLQTSAIVAVEALLRWHHPQRGLMLPAQFISIAKDCGLITTIGRSVLRNACCQARQWQEAGLPPVRIAVNVSAVELRNKDFVDGVRAILAETGLEPQLLELELIEIFLMQDLRSPAEVLQALKSLGVKLVLDDFGTGYSSLSYLKRFPIDTLKIDQSLVGNLPVGDADTAGIVSAVIDMGHNFGLQVIAEGVETADQFAFVRQHGCRQCQGSYFSAPVTAAACAMLLKQACLPGGSRPVAAIAPAMKEAHIGTDHA